MVRYVYAGANWYRLESILSKLPAKRYALEAAQTAPLTNHIFCFTWSGHMSS